ncbi:MAG: hypothetical protein JST22_07285 [Bacteroidetes bacterium]|nr:hypothetical protein [Bacteroidota bacterium]
MSNPAPAKKYSQLSDEQKAIVTSKRADARHTPSEWITMLGEIAAFDRVGDRDRSRAGWGCGTSIILSIICLAVFWKAAIVPIVIAIIFAIRYANLKKVDVPNSLRESLLPLLALLREDMDAGAMLRLTFDLRDGTRKENMLAEESLPPRRYISLKELRYSNAWFSGEGALADGSSVAWEITDLIRIREVTKRSSSGKIKMKKKNRVRRVIDMRVGLRQDEYVWHGGGDAIDSLKVSTKSGDKRTVVKLRRVVEDGSTLHPRFDVRYFIDTLAGAYRRASLAGEEGRKP